MRLVFALAAAAAVLAAGLAFAAELQVPLDRAGRVQRIDAALARRLRMFTDRPDFQEARLFQLEDSTFVLEVASLSGAALKRDRIPLTAAGADSLRDAVTTALAERHTEPTLDASGRPLFVVTTTAMCFGFYGWAIPYLFMEDAPAEVATGTYLVTASAGTFIPLWLTRNRSVSTGTALMSWYGMSRGAMHGAVLANALAEDPGEKAPVGTAFALSIAEGIAGFEWAARSGMSEGTAASINTMGDFGTLYGVGLASLADATRQPASAAALAGAGAGLVAGAIYAPRRQHTYGDASAMRTAGLVGGYLGLAATGAMSGGDAEGDSYTLAAIAGSVAGLVVGDQLVRRTDFTFGQGVMLDFSTFGGWLFGLGVGYIASGTSDLDETGYWVATGLGTVAGYSIGYAVSAKSARRAATDRTSWRFDLAPTPPERRGQLPGVRLTLATALR